MMLIVLALVLLVALGAGLFVLSQRRTRGEPLSAPHLAGDWREVAAEMAVGARDAVLRFPVTVVVLFLLALYANLLISGIEPLGERDEDVLLALFAASGASLASSLFCERRGVSALTSAAASLAAALLAFVAIWWDRSLGVYPQALVVAVAGLVLVAPYLGRGDGAAFWMFCVRFAFAVLLAGLALLLFAGGISAIFASLTYLFGLPVPDEAYGHVWAVTGLFAAPLFGLGQIPRDFETRPDATAADFMERGMRALGDFAAAPLLLVYALILHLYALKIVITGEVPQGQIGWLVLAFGVCVVGSLIVIHPFLDAARAPTRLFLGLWPFTLPVPLALLLYAVALRIADHGLTPDRYLLALFGFTAAAIVALQLFRSTRGDIRYMAALPAFALLLASFGPQGAMKTSIRSQDARFEALVASGPLEGERHDQALSALRFLQWNGALDKVTPEGMRAADSQGDSNQDDVLFREIAARYGIDPDLALAPDASFSRNYFQPSAFAVAGYDLATTSVGIFEGHVDPQPVTLPSGQALRFHLDGNAVVVASGGRQARFAITADDLQRIASVAPPDPDRVTEPAEPLVLQDGSRRLMIVPSNINGDNQGRPVIRNMTGAILLRSEDWPLRPMAGPSRP